MTEYEKMIEKVNLYQLKAIELFQRGEIDLARFFNNASIGLKRKALNLILEGE